MRCGFRNVASGCGWHIVSGHQQNLQDGAHSVPSCRGVAACEGGGGELRAGAQPGVRGCGVGEGAGVSGWDRAGPRRPNPSPPPRLLLSPTGAHRRGHEGARPTPQWSYVHNTGRGARHGGLQLGIGLPGLPAGSLAGARQGEARQGQGQGQGQEGRPGGQGRMGWGCAGDGAGYPDHHLDPKVPHGATVLHASALGMGSGGGRGDRGWEARGTEGGKR